MHKKALGRGLDALISGGIPQPAGVDSPRAASPAAVPLASHPPVETVALGGSVVRHIELDAIEPSRFQPRTAFDPAELHELAESIRQRGVIQPLVLRPVATTPADGKRRYELIAGERRWRAARDAGMTTIPAIVREATDQEALEIALIENLQREDLNPIEEARAYEQLARQFQLTQEQIAAKVVRSRAAVANALRLLGLPPEVQAWVAADRLSVGHAKAILGLATTEEQRLVAERVLKQELTVRATEDLVEHLKGLVKGAPRSLTSTRKDPNIATLEERLQQKLGTGVTVHHRPSGKGRIQIEYYSNDELSRLLGVLGIENL